VAASMVDRAVYASELVLLFRIVSLVHSVDCKRVLAHQFQLDMSLLKSIHSLNAIDMIYMTKILHLAVCEAVLRALSVVQRGPHLVN
jgi:hypothetical protein